MDTFRDMLGRLKALEYRTEVPASELTTFRIGGAVRYVLYPADTATLCAAARLCRQTETPFRIMGCGSNVLARDEGYDGVWILTERCRKMTVLEHRVEVCAGMPLDELIDRCRMLGLGGLENLTGIPGSVGGAAVMNAGAFGTQMTDYLTAVNVYDIERDEVYSIPYESCGYSYRRSLFQDGGYVILGVALRLPKSRADIIGARSDAVREKRMQSQPYELPSAGSVFRRPNGHFAGKLISEAGFSGYRVGDACVSPKHNGFIVNLGHATSKDVTTVIGHIRKKIFESTGVLLQTELVIE